jgi:hypothetical protein
MIERLLKIKELISEYADKESYHTVDTYQSESISGGGGWSETTATYLDEKDAQEAIKIIDELINE